MFRTSAWPCPANGRVSSGEPTFLISSPAMRPPSASVTADALTPARHGQSIAGSLCSAEILIEHPKHWWERLLLHRLGNDAPPPLDTTIITLQTPAEMQRRALDKMRARSQRSD